MPNTERSNVCVGLGTRVSHDSPKTLAKVSCFRPTGEIAPHAVLEEMATCGEPLLSEHATPLDLSQAAHANLPIRLQLYLRELELQLAIAREKLSSAECRVAKLESAQAPGTHFKATAVQYRGRLLHLVTKEELGRVLGCSASQVDSYSRRGILPPPIEFPRAFVDQAGERAAKSDRGNKYLRWDLYEVLGAALQHKRAS